MQWTEPEIRAGQRTFSGEKLFIKEYLNLYRKISRWGFSELETEACEKLLIIYNNVQIIISMQTLSCPDNVLSHVSKIILHAEWTSYVDIG